MALGSYPDLDPGAAKAAYGPWAVISGASDGTGAEYAHSLARLGLNVLLIARRDALLTSLARDIQAQHGVQTRTLVLDLMSVDAGARIVAAAADLEVGLYVSNAGADGSGSGYVDSPVERWLNVTNMNVRTVTHVTHELGKKMVARGRGGILMMSSLAALGGQPWLAMYSATKAFEMVLAEALWSEFGESGVHVLSVLAPSMDTPTFRAGVAGTDFDVSTAYAPDGVVREALAHLPHGPLLIYPYTMTEAEADELARARFDRLLAMAEIGKSLKQQR